MKTLRYFLFSTFFCMLFSSAVFSQQTMFGKTVYKNIEVEKFTVQEKVEYETAELDNMMSAIVFTLQKTKKFANVTLLNPESEKAPLESTLKVTGEITKYSKGNRAARYLIGFGAGATKVKAKVKFIDVASGKVLLEKEVDGTVWIGFFGGDSNGAKSGLAKDIAELAKKNFGDPSRK